MRKDRKGRFEEYYPYMEMVELIDRCLYEDELRDILMTIGERPEGAKEGLITKLMESKKDPIEVVSLIDEDMLTMICLELGIPTMLGREEMVDQILSDVLGEVHDYKEITAQPENDVADHGNKILERDLPVLKFDDVLTTVGEWTPPNIYIPRTVMTEKLGDFLKENGYSVKIKVDADLRVGRNVSIELVRGRNTRDIEDLLDRMVEDLGRFEYTIGIMYGVETESMVEKLENALEDAFEDPERVAIVVL
jgi:hypothetical protein